MPVLQGGVYTAELIPITGDLSSASVSVQVVAPDGTTVTGITAVKAADNKSASAAIPATMLGTYLIGWSTSNPTGAVQDQFTCVPLEADLISLPDLKDELNLRATNADIDDKLRRWTKAATNVIENVTGPLRMRPVVDVFDGGTPTVVLNDFWVNSIVSVVEHWGSASHALTEQPLGTSVDQYGYTWDRDTNMLTRRDGGGNASFFAPGRNSVVCTYRAGFPVMPDDIQLAAAELVKHWYRKSLPISTRGGSVSRAYGQPGEEYDTVGNYLVPNAVMELLEPWRRPPGIF